MRTASAFTEIMCKGCGRTRSISTRQARRAPELCRSCRLLRDGPKKIVASDSDKRYWLRRFTDTEIAEMATDMLGRVIRPEVIAHNRAALTASASPSEPKE